MKPARTAASARFHLAQALAVTALAGTLAGVAITAVEPVAGLVEPDAAVRYGLPVVRVLLDVAAVVTVGMSLLPLLVGHDRPARTEPVLAGSRRFTAVSALVWAVCALMALVLRTSEVRPGEPVAPAAVLSYVDQVAAGKALLFVAVVALVSFGLGLAAVRLGERVPAQLRTAVALLALLPLPMTGHATNVRWQDVTMVSLELHVLCAATWTGGLASVALLLAANRSLLATALPRFSKLATVCLVVVAATGVVNGLAELTATGDLADVLFGTGYGVLVLLKLGCLGMLAALGAHVRWRLLPAIVRQRRTSLVAWATAEVAVMGLAIGFAAALSRSPVS